VKSNIEPQVEIKAWMALQGLRADAALLADKAWGAARFLETGNLEGARKTIEKIKRLKATLDEGLEELTTRFSALE